MSKIILRSLHATGNNAVAEFVVDGLHRKMRLGMKFDMAVRMPPQEIARLIERRLDMNYRYGLGPRNILVTHPDRKSPPQLAEFLFSLFAPKKTVAAQLGDLQELHAKNCKRFGKGRADRLYWAQVLRALGPGIWRRVKKLGFIGILIDYGRSKIGW